MGTLKSRGAVRPRLLQSVLALSAAFSTSVYATEIELSNGGKLSVTGAATLGVEFRTDEADPKLLYTQNAAAVGQAGVAPAGRNGDDGNLNYRKGDAVSQVLKGWASITYTQGQFGATLSGKGWYDFVQENHNVGHGNSINGYAANQPLSDAGLSQRAKFKNIVLNEANIFGNHSLSDGQSASWKLGWQRLDWGNQYYTFGGLRDLMPVDVPGDFRPGVQRDEESRIPIPLAFAKWKMNDATSVEGFMQFGFTPNVGSACGAFYSQSDYAVNGCNMLIVGPAATDAGALAGGGVVNRSKNDAPSGLGQFGLAFKHKLASGTELGAYYTQFDSRSFYNGVVKSSRATGNPWLPGDPGGLNPTYFSIYPERIRMFSGTFDMPVNKAVKMYGELDYRPNQPMGYNGLDLINAFVTNTGATLLRDAASNTAVGEAFEGYERHKMIQLQLGNSTKLPGILGATGVSLGAQAVGRWVPDLPNKDVTRFRRPDVSGLGPVNGVCTGTALACSNDGFVSRTAWGYRLQAGLLYKDAFEGVDVIPSIFFGHDVSGWSDDGSMSQGRRLGIVSLKAIAKKTYTAELAWRPTWGGDYNVLRDRSTAQLIVGVLF